MGRADDTREMQNVFGHTIPGLPGCLEGELSVLLGDLLCGLLTVRAGAAPGHAAELTRELFALIRRHREQGPAAKACRGLLAREGLLAGLRGDLPARSGRMARQVRPHLRGPAVLDFGCGDGRVGAALSGVDLRVGLCDLVDARHPDARGLPWRQVEPRLEARLFDTAWDTALVLNVLHHSFSPLEALRQVAAQEPRRVVTIESVHAVVPETIPAAEWERVVDDNPAAAVWLTLSAKDQLAHNAFWDWLFTQVINELDRTPFNYQPADRWSEHLASLGYREVERRHLGIDQPLVPEYHVLQVFDRTEAPAAGGQNHG